MTLDKEAIYFIVQKIYKDEIDFIDKTEYDLDKQVTVRSLSKKLLSSKITDEEYKTLLDWLDNEDNILIFLDELTVFRSGNKTFNDQEFSFVTEIFKKALDKMSIKHNKNIERNIIILSDTFSKEIEKDKKVFISDEIKDHKLFYDKILWENIIEYEIKENMKRYEGEKERKSAEMSCFMMICYSLKSFVSDTNKRKEIIKDLSKKYQNNNKDQLEALLLQIDSGN